MPPSDLISLGQPPATIDWNGSPTTLAVQQRAVMAQTSNGSMILAFQNISEMNNAGKLSLTSGGSQPQFLVAPALALQPTILINNWQADNLNLANISANTNTPIWIAAFGPCLGSPPQTLPAECAPVYS